MAGVHSYLTIHDCGTQLPYYSMAVVPLPYYSMAVVPYYTWLWYTATLLLHGCGTQLPYYSMTVVQSYLTIAWLWYTATLL